MREIDFQKLRGETIVSDVTSDAPVEVLFAGGVCVGTKGEFSVVVGHPKTKKTFNMIAIAASALSGKEVAGWRVKMQEGKPKVMYLDTEMSRCHTERTRKRICQAAGRGTSDKDLLVFSLKKMTVEERTEFLQELLKREGDVGLVILDGVRDLVNDVNDNTAAHRIAEMVEKWADEFGIHLITTLHLNKTDKSPRGHLGTEVTAKAESLILLEKEKHEDSTKVSPLELRDVEFSPFFMTVSEDGLPIKAK